MYRLYRFLRKIFTPITIMVVPHSRVKSFGVRVPFAVIVFSIVMFLVGTVFVATATVRTVEYHAMKERLAYISTHLQEMNATIHSLRRADEQFRKLFSLKSKKEVIEKFTFEDAGSLDMEALRKEIEASMDSVADIRAYIAAQKDLFLATPSGWPVPGRISSGYGNREHPVSGDRRFHSGVDISVHRGTSVKATADGIVSYSGYSEGSGNTVVIEHGHGFSTAYAHNERNLVAVGKRVRRGDAIAASGSTGTSTGPHVHYEIWRHGRHVDPDAYLARR